MPQHKLPLSLYKLSLAEAHKLIINACENVTFTKYLFGSIECTEQIAAVQQYILHNIPVQFLDDMLALRLKQSANTQKDPRILLALLLNNRTKYFKVQAEIDVNIPVPFWIKSISNLVNIISLDLSHVCTDEILEIIGQNCLRVEYINIVSGYKRVPSDFNALLLEHFVTDKGLNYLLNCQQLKKIELDEPRCKYKVQGITCNGIYTLLKNLKNLEEMSYLDIGSIISRRKFEQNSLKLKKIKHFNATKENILTIEKTCPNLQHLLLTDFKKESSSSEEMMQCLASSLIKVEFINFENFSFTTQLQNFLTLKGKFLTRLSLISNYDGTLTTDAVITIGINCPNLKVIHLEKLVDSDQVKYYEHPQGLFKNIEAVVLAGRDWNYSKVLSIVLRNASNIKKVSCAELNLNSTHQIDSVMWKITEDNINMKYLTVLQLFKPFEVSSIFVEYVLSKFPNLYVFQCWCNDKTHCQNLYEKYDSENYDLSFRYNSSISGISIM